MLGTKKTIVRNRPGDHPVSVSVRFRAPQIETGLHPIPDPGGR
jgi:hypothetical protein